VQRLLFLLLATTLVTGSYASGEIARTYSNGQFCDGCKEIKKASVKVVQSYADVATYLPSTYREKICFEEFHKDSGRIWRNFIDIGTHPFLSPGECDAYVSADRLTWIGGKLDHQALTSDSDGSFDLSKLGRTPEDFTECYSMVHTTDPIKLEGRLFSRWHDIVDHASGGTNINPAVAAIIELCRPFLSADTRVWSVPSPEKLRDQLVKTSSKAAIANPEAISVELEFWQSVKDSDNADMLRAYLEEYPDGKFKSLAQIKLNVLIGISKTEYFWCATKSAVAKHTKESCDQLGGKSFDNKDSALNEKKRLNAGKSTIDKAINLSGYWEVEHTISSSAGALEPYTLIVQLEQDGNSVSSVTVVELQTSESIPCNDNGGRFDVNGVINGDAFTGTIVSANLDSRFSLTGDHKELTGTYNSRWLAGICAGEMSGSVTARRLSDDAIRQLTSSIGNNAVQGSGEPANNTKVEYFWCARKNSVVKHTRESCNQLGGKSFDNKDSALNEKKRLNAGKSTIDKAINLKVEKECFDDFHRYGGSEWRRAVQGQAADGPVDDVDLHKCKPFVSEDMSTWIGSDPGEKKIENQTGASNELTQEVTLPKTNWCGKSVGAYQLSAQECVSGHGVPMRTKSDAEWVSRQYFGEYETHKAFAISEQSIGLAAYRVNSEAAKQQALFTCNMRAVKATTCRVINIDGVQADYANFRRSSRPVFSSSGKLEELTGHYRLTLRSSDGIMGDLFIEVKGDKIGGSIQLCYESGRCANFQINEIFEKRRGRFFRSGLSVKTNPGGRWPEEAQLSVSLSSDTSILVGQFGSNIFDGERYSD
jgi:hypothetical protein